MATAGDGAATANTYTASASQGAGGAGGKFRKKLFRRQSTPYDRPPNAIRGSNSSSSWLTKLVVDPASKLISYGADRFFASVFRKRLPPPPPLSQSAEVKDDVNDPARGDVLDSQYGAQLQKPVVGECSHPTNNFSTNTISELEQLLKQKTFSRSEVDYLKGLLQSRVVDVSGGDHGKNKEETAASDYGRHKQHQHAKSPLEENVEGTKSPAVMSPIFNSKVIEDHIASPAELAKAYMGNRPSEVSPSPLGMRSQVAGENKDLLSKMSLAPKSASLPLTLKTSVGLRAPENGFITPKSRGRTAIYNMARSPYSRFHPTAALKGSGKNSHSYVEPAMPSSSLSLVENDEKFETRPVTLKRGSSALDVDVGSVGPIRRIRQKPNLLAPRIYHSSHALGIGSDLKQKTKSTDAHRFKGSETLRENENGSVPVFNHACVPSKSSETAARIFQHLESLTPKEKSSESKLVTEQKQSPLKLMPSMSGKARRSMEDVSTMELLLDVSKNNKSLDRTNTIVPDAHYSLPQKQGKLEENGSKDSHIQSDMQTPMTSNDYVVSLKASGPGTRNTDSVAETYVSRPPQKHKVFRMSAQEDYLEQDDDAHCDALAARPFSENKGAMSAPFTVTKFSAAEEPKLVETIVRPEVPKLVKTTIQPEVKSPSGLISNQASEPNNIGSATVGEESNAITFQSSESTSASQSALLPVSIPAFDKPKEANVPRPVFSFSSKAADTFLPSETSSKREESKLDGPSSLVNISASTGSQTKDPEMEKDGHVNPLKAGDSNGKSITFAPVKPDGPVVSMPPSMSCVTVDSNVNQISAGGALLSTPSSSIASLGTSTSATSTTSIFGLVGAPSISAGPVFKFGASIETSSAVSGAARVTEIAELKAKVAVDPSLGSSSISLPTLPAFAAASSGSGSSGPGSSSVSHSTPNNLQGSLFSGTSFGMNSQMFRPNNIFGASSSASASQTSAVADTGLTSSTVKFGTTSVSEGNAVTSTSGATPSIFGFGPSSSASEGSAVTSSSGATPSIFGFGHSSSTSTAVGSSNGATTPVFGFGSSSSVSSQSSGTSSTFNFGGSSSSSSAAINPFSSSNAPSNVFGASWQSPKSAIFGSTFASPSPSTGFSFATSSASTNTAPMLFNSSTGASSSPSFSFTTASASVLSSPPVPTAQPVFGSSGFAAASGNYDQMNAEDSMAEDPIQASAPSVVPVFGQPSLSPSAPGFAFGSQPSNPFVFGGQQNQVAPAQNTSPFQASSSLEFNAGGSFSLGSGGGDKSGRRIVKPSRNKNRRK